MATANIELKDGTKIVIEGQPEEIAKVLELYRPKTFSEVQNALKKTATFSTPRKESKARSRNSATQIMRSLIEDQFFDERRSIAEVQIKLEELGHIYPQTHLSTPLRRLVQSRELRRLREGKSWLYVIAR